MGFLDNIGKKIKKTYQKVDVKLGGYLPGGKKPSEVTTKKEAKKASEPTEKVDKKPSVTSTDAKADTMIDKVDTTAQEQDFIGKGNTLTDAELSTIPRNERPLMINTLTGKEMFAIQETEEEKRVFGKQNIKETLGAFGMMATASGAVNLVIKNVGSYLSTRGTSALTTNPVANSAAGKFTTRNIVNIRAGATVGQTRGAIGAAKPGTIVNIGQANTKTGGLLLGLITNARPAVKVGAAVVGAAMTVASSYIFSGFIEEEASQQLTYAYNTALDEGDLEGAQAILDLDEEIWDDGFINSIPLINGIDAIKDYYKAQKIAREGKQKQLDRIARGELTPAETKKQFDNDQIYGKVDPETGEYILSPTEQAKRDEAAEYYDNLRSEAGEATSNYNKSTGKYEPRSTLGFGLLRTPGEVLPDKKKESDAQRLYGKPYDELSESQKEVVDNL